MRTVSDRHLILYGPLIHYAAATLFFNTGAFFDPKTPLLPFLLFGVTSVYLTWVLARWIVTRVQNQYKGLEHSNRRILTLLVLSFPTVGLLVAVRLLVLKYWVLAGIEEVAWFSPDTLFMAGLNLFSLVVIFSVYESRYFFRQWLLSRQQTEELIRSNLEMQLDSLKSQVQPHFLFNSLNTLQALVRSAENKRAMHFIGDLSQVYRYLLQSNEHQLISLEKELAFTHAYFNLMKTRFHEGLWLEVAIDPVYRTYQLPPLTLQLLVENAVKHNLVSASRPLRIRIETAGDGTLTIWNNLQRKPRRSVISSRKGLLTITARYSLLNQAPVQINETEHAFQVKIPLINAFQP